MYGLVTVGDLELVFLVGGWWGVVLSDFVGSGDLAASDVGVGSGEEVSIGGVAW